MNDKRKVEVSVSTIQLALMGLAVLRDHVDETAAQLTAAIMVPVPRETVEPTDAGSVVVVKRRGRPSKITDGREAKAITARRAGFTPEVRSAMSNRVKALWADPKYRAQVLRKRAITLRRKKREMMALS